LKSYSFLFWAYAIVWVGIAGYALFLSARLRKVERRLDGIEKR
jgi:CcmD family protein